jgi:Lon protease-like protein
MSRSPFELTYQDLPAELPVFPLSGVLLLPRGRLPLNIFEPRYLNMTGDALAAPDRLIGMLQPVDPESEEREPGLYRIGCAGRITSFSETEDGRYLITLTGISRFRLVEEIDGRGGYRRVRAAWEDFRGDFDDVSELSIDRARLLTGLKEFFKLHGIAANWDAIEQTPDERLITSLAMICPFEPPEKQALLEAPDLAARGSLMMTLVEMAILEQNSSSGDSARH